MTSTTTTTGGNSSEWVDGEDGRKAAGRAPGKRVASTATTWTLALVSAALFMVTLDNLVVTTALPSIRVDLGASIGDLEWTVNAYTLAYAVFLLTGSALGDRFGRRT